MTHPHVFTSVLPSEAQKARMDTMSTAFLGLLSYIHQHVPEGPDRTYVIRKVRETAMWCNVAIMRNPDGSPRSDDDVLPDPVQTASDA